MQDRPISDKIRRFIRKAIRTTWTLETLLFLLRHQSQSWSTSSLVKELRSSELAISGSVSQLVRIGLVIEIDRDMFQYRPANEELAELADNLKELNAGRPYALIEEIAAAQGAGAQDFADAFKLRKD